MEMSRHIFQYKSPNGSAIVGTLEIVTCRVDIHGIDENGEPSFAGGSTMFWDEQRPVERDGKPLFLDEDGFEWTLDQLIRVSEYCPEIEE